MVVARQLSSSAAPPPPPAPTTHIRPAYHLGGLSRYPVRFAPAAAAAFQPLRRRTCIVTQEPPGPPYFTRPATASYNSTTLGARRRPRCHKKGRAAPRPPLSAAATCPPAPRPTRRYLAIPRLSDSHPGCPTSTDLRPSRLSHSREPTVEACARPRTLATPTCSPRRRSCRCDDELAIPPAHRAGEGAGPGAARRPDHEGPLRLLCRPAEPRACRPAARHHRRQPAQSKSVLDSACLPRVDASVTIVITIPHPRLLVYSFHCNASS